MREKDIGSLDGRFCGDPGFSWRLCTDEIRIVTTGVGRSCGRHPRDGIDSYLLGAAHTQ